MVVAWEGQLEKCFSISSFDSGDVSAKSPAALTGNFPDKATPQSARNDLTGRLSGSQ